MRFDHGITLRAVASAAGVAPESLRPALYGDLEHQLDTGALSPRDFFRRVEKRAGIGPLPDEVWVPAWRDIFEPIPEALALLDRLRPGVRTALVSNTNALHWEGVLKICDVDRRVDALALSFEIGAAKPDPEIFEAALDRLGAGPLEAVFADDRPPYVEAARSLGLDAFVVDGPASLHAGLEARGLLD